MATLTETIQQTLQPFVARAKHDHIHVTFIPPPSGLAAEGDLNSIIHDVAYLVEHILNFIPENEKIEVTLIAHNGSSAITISNTGIDLRAFTGVLKGCVLPASIESNEPNGTKYILALRESLNPMPVVAKHNITSDNNFYFEIQQRLRSHFTKSDNLLHALQSNPRDAAFLSRVNQVIQDNLSKEDFDVNRLADLMNMSRTQLFRKLKPIIRQSASAYIRSLRLKKAKEMLETTDLRVSEAAYLTGFDTPSGFTKVFVKYFGFKPSAIARNKSETNGLYNATNPLRP